MAQRSELAPGVFAIQERLEDPTRIKYDVANETDARLDMTVDLNGSENIAFANGELSREVHVEAKSARYAGTAFVTDPSKGWRLAAKFNWTATRLVPVKKTHEDQPKAAAGSQAGHRHQHNGDYDAGDHDADCEDRNRVRLPEGDDRLPRRQNQAPAKGPTAEKQPTQTRKELEPGLTIIRSQFEEPTKFHFRLENKLQLSVELTIDLSDSENIKTSQGGRKLEIKCDPEDEMDVGSAAVQRPNESWSLSTRYGWRKVQPPVEYLNAKAAKDEKEIKRIQKAYALSPLHKGDDALTMTELISRCRELNVKFIDTEFLPDSTSIYEPDSGFVDPNLPITWRSAKDLFEGDYDVFEKGIEPSDIKQGRLGDCWLMCALASLAEFPSLVRSLFQISGGGPQKRNDAGVYQVRICKHGQWRNVRLDDYFPAFPGGGPVYSRANGNELWVMLVEKAFAKLSGCYDMLRGGLAYEALMDLTGCPTTCIAIKDKPKDELWDLLVREDNNENVMSASVPGEDKWSQVGGRDIGGPGLVSGHAYTLQQAKQTRDGHRLLCLRNPWGEYEWNGDWSDTSPLWTDAIKAELNPTLNESDGLFWMSFQDFTRHFQRINICHTHCTSGAHWMECRHKGLVEYTDAGVRCPHFRLRVKRASEVWISMHQDDERVLHAQPYIDLDFIVVRENGAGSHEVVDRIHGRWDRQTQLHIGRLEQGDYLVVPYTSNIMRQREIHRRLEDIFDADGVINMTYLQILWEVFRRYDDDMDSFLSTDELLKVLETGFGKEAATENTARDYIGRYDSRGSKMSRDGFVQLVADLSEDKIRELISNWGYDDQLRLATQRGFVVSIHSEGPVSLSKLPHNDELYRLSMKEMMAETQVLAQKA